MTSAGASLRKRSVTIAGHRTSISLEAPFWEALARLAGERDVSVQSLVAEVDAGRGASNLSSALRIFILTAYMTRAGQNGTA